MSWVYRKVVRPVLFSRDSESVHDRTLGMLEWVSRHAVLCEALASFFQEPEMPVEIAGLRFPNPVGLAAGMDKRASAVPAWEALGFGFMELGGVTRHPQPGNPAPRMFRAVAEEALINRMGFNNRGAAAMAETLRDWRRRERWPAHPVGINLGKSRITPLDRAAGDYASSFRELRAVADFFVVNVSSPNTPNLRQLQDKTALDEILAELGRANREWTAPPPVPPDGPALASRAEPRAKPRPIFVKVAPDLSFDALDEILELVEPRGIAGIVATNTTIARPEAASDSSRRVFLEAGGLSGRPLRSRSTEVVRHLHRSSRGAVPIIGVGGIFTAEDAWEKITAGASLVQLYTGLVYEGPGVAGRILRGLRQRLNEAGLEHIRQAVGIANDIKARSGANLR